MIAAGFTPVSAALGGAAIGLAATLLYAGIGRIAGISGIVNAVFDSREGRGWRLVFLGGLLLGAGAWFAWTPGVAPLHGDSALPRLAIAGLLVGAGTRIGGGCTSGHGICGLARLSPRSLAAVAVFMGCGMLTVLGMRGFQGAPT